MITIEELEKAGLQYGHTKTRNHPKAEYFIIKSNITNVKLINLEETKKGLEKAIEVVKEMVKNNKVILFVGTQAGAKQKILEIAQKYEYPYVVERWLGGTLTNFKTLVERIKYLKDLENQQQSGAWDNFTKKEKNKLLRELLKLQRKFMGLRNMTKIPDLLIVIDPGVHKIAVKEAKKLNIPIIALLDTDDDPSQVTYPIPGNDSAKSAICYVLNKIEEAISEIQNQLKINQTNEKSSAQIQPQNI